VPSGSKIIACSDGVWDVFTEAKVATMIQGSRDPLKAARRVVGAAKQARLYNGIVADDISAIVINLD
jgi:serine/threonine protein phosphatase PrpC